MKNKKRIIQIIVLFIIISLGYYFLNKYLGFVVPCMIKKITGFDCPGCGITRMLFALVRLDIYQAFRFNPLIFILLLGYILVLILRLFNVNIPWTNKHAYVLLALVIAFGIMRNLEAFAFLKPTLIP